MADSQDVDYGALIGAALTGGSANGNRSEAAARLALALVFYEAAKACSAAHQHGFPLVLNTSQEDFELAIGDGIYVPRVSFSRSKTQLRVRGHNIPASALDAAQELSEDWEPGAMDWREIQERVKNWSSRAVTALAHAQAAKLKK